MFYTIRYSVREHADTTSVFEKNLHLMGRLGSGPHVIGRLGSGAWVSASCQIFAITAGGIS